MGDWKFKHGATFKGTLTDLKTRAGKHPKLQITHLSERVYIEPTDLVLRVGDESIIGYDQLDGTVKMFLRTDNERWAARAIDLMNELSNEPVIVRPQKKIEDRRRKVKMCLAKTDLKVWEIAERLMVSEATIKRDVRELKKRGEVALKNK